MVVSSWATTYHSMSAPGMRDIVTAITISSDGYFYRLGLKMGEERFAKMGRYLRSGRGPVSICRTKILDQADR